jgi:hypothetical protein
LRARTKAPTSADRRRIDRASKASRYWVKRSFARDRMSATAARSNGPRVGMSDPEEARTSAKAIAKTRMAIAANHFWIGRGSGCRSSRNVEQHEDEEKRTDGAGVHDDLDGRHEWREERSRQPALKKRRGRGHLDRGDGPP